MAAPSYIKYGTTQCTDIQATNFQTTGTVDMNYVYFNSGNSKFNCVYKRPDPTSTISGSFYIPSGSNGYSNQVTSASLTITGNYSYYQTIDNSSSHMHTYNYVNGSHSYQISSGELVVTLQTNYYTPCDTSRNPLTSYTTTAFLYTITGSVTIQYPYYPVTTSSSVTVPNGTFKINDVNNSSNNYQYLSSTINFTWTNARWYSSTSGRSVNIGTGSKQARQIKFIDSSSSAYECPILFRLSNGNIVYSKEISSTQTTLECVKSSLYIELYLTWATSANIGKEYYVGYKKLGITSSSSTSYKYKITSYGSWIYTDVTSATISLDSNNALKPGTTDIDLSITNNIATLYSYLYLGFAHSSGDYYKITNKDNISHTVYYNSKKCNQSDARNWTNLSDIKSTTISANGSTTVTISGNWFADSETCSFTNSSYRYISYRYDSYSSSQCSNYRINK